VLEEIDDVPPAIGPPVYRADAPGIEINGSGVVNIVE
jgi:hypothetical protein